MKAVKLTAQTGDTSSHQNTTQLLFLRSLALAGVKSFSCEVPRNTASLARENPDSSASPAGRLQTQGISLPRAAVFRGTSHENDLKPDSSTGASQTLEKYFAKMWLSAALRAGPQEASQTPPRKRGVWYT